MLNNPKWHKISVYLSTVESRSKQRQILPDF